MWPFSSSLPATTSSDINSARKVTFQQRPLIEDAQQHNATTPQTIGYQAPPLIPDASSIDLGLIHQPYERLGMPPALRFPLFMTAGFITGFGLGATTGGRVHADRFRAENAHRFPTTQAGWYLYHRTKGYVSTVGAVKQGVGFGLQLGIWVGVFCGIEEGVDRLRGRVVGRWKREDWEEGVKTQRDVGSTLVAGTSVAGLYCAVKRMDRFATAKLVRTSVRYSLAFGLAQDLLSTMKRERPAYVEWLLKRSHWSKGQQAA